MSLTSFNPLTLQVEPLRPRAGKWLGPGPRTAAGRAPSPPQSCGRSSPLALDSSMNWAHPGVAQGLGFLICDLARVASYICPLDRARRGHN